MRLLLDTHALLWWDGNARLLSDTARFALQDSSNTIFMSRVNAWEMQIKAQIGKLTLLKPTIDTKRVPLSRSLFGSSAQTALNPSVCYKAIDPSGARTPNTESRLFGVLLSGSLRVELAESLKAV